MKSKEEILEKIMETNIRIDELVKNLRTQPLPVLDIQRKRKELDTLIGYRQALNWIVNNSNH